MARLTSELFDPIVSAKGLCIERIVSTGQATPAGEWLDQDQDEGVILLRGEAALERFSITVRGAIHP